MRTKLPLKEEFILTVVYEFNEKSRRRDLWNELRYQRNIYSNMSWVIIGDFNIIMNSQENSETKRMYRSAIQKFAKWIQYMDIYNIPSRCFEFT